MNYAEWVLEGLEEGVAYVVVKPTEEEREAWLQNQAGDGLEGNFTAEDYAILKAHLNAPLWIVRA